jgi:hypothetical protein
MHVCMCMEHLTAEMFWVCCPGFVVAEVAALLMMVAARICRTQMGHLRARCSKACWAVAVLALWC